MKKITFGIMVLFATLAFTACVDDPDILKFPTEQFYPEIKIEPLTQDYVVAAMYTEMTAGYWYKTVNNRPVLSMPEYYTGTPTLGEADKNGGYFIDSCYDRSAAPGQGAPCPILRQQLDWGKKAGIDFFIVNWNGHGTDTLLFNFQNTWQPGDPQVALVFDCGHLYTRVADSLHKDIVPLRTKTKFLRQIDSLKTMFFAEPYYYKLNGATPVFGLDNYARTNDISETVAEVREKIGSVVYLISPTIERGNGYTSPEFIKGLRYFKGKMPFDAMYQPAMLTDNYDRYGWDTYQNKFFNIINDNYKYWKEHLGEGKDFIPSVMPAFDNSKNDSTSHVLRLQGSNKPVLARETTGLLYERYAMVGKQNAGKYRMVIINSWNNYRQGSGLEPTAEYGETYLDFTRKYFKKN